MKQRLVGAVVLGCLAIIFLPILLDGEGVSAPEMNIVIPAAPAFPEPLNVEPERPVVLSDTSEIVVETEIAVEVVDAIAVNSDPNPELPGLNTEGLPQGWSIRLGLFGDKANADALLTNLLNQGYRAYSEIAPTSRGELTAILVGPVLTTSEAENLRLELSETFNVEALIVDFGINEDSNE